MKILNVGNVKIFRDIKITLMALIIVLKYVEMGSIKVRTNVMMVIRIMVMGKLNEIN